MKFDKKQEALAKNLVKEIKKASTAFQEPIYEFVETKSYIVFGHDSFKSWCKDKEEELGVSYDSMNSYYHTARITDIIFGEDFIGKIQPFVLKPLRSLDDDELSIFEEKIEEELGTNNPLEMKLTNIKVKEFLKKFGLGEQPKANKKMDVSADKTSKLEKRQKKFFDTIKTNKSKNLSTKIATAANKWFSLEGQIKLCKKILELEKNDVTKDIIEDLNDVLDEL